MWPDNDSKKPFELRTQPPQPKEAKTGIPIEKNVRLFRRSNMTNLFKAYSENDEKYSD